MLNETESMDESYPIDEVWHINEMLDDKCDETDLQMGLFARRNNSKDSKLQDTIVEPAALTFRLLEEITDGFSQERIIREGEFGKIYRGVYKNGETVAVKVLSCDYILSDERFDNEVRNHMRLNHPNIVRLVGYCYETRQKHVDYDGKILFAEMRDRALCFEYMHNGNLQRHLADEFNGPDWFLRYRIIKGTCEGLKYLHKECKEPVYHLDLKPGHILLDRNMVPKLADFAMSKIFDEELTMVTNIPFGTIQYLPPEYLELNLVSNKLDIYALGVVMIKIIAGPAVLRRKAESSTQEFIDIVQGNWRTRLQTKWGGSSLEAYCEQVNICIRIALNCMEIDRHKRPDIVDILDMMNQTESAIGQLKMNRRHQWTR